MNKLSFVVGPILGASLLLIPACATTTPYDTGQANYGFSETSVENGTYKVSFRGNAQTPRSTVEDYLLLHMAELTLEQDQDYFTVKEQETDCFITIRTSPTSECTIHQPHDAIYPYYSVDVEPKWFWQSGPKKEYETIAFFTMGTGLVPLDDSHTFVARDVSNRLSHLKEE